MNTVGSLFSGIGGLDLGLERAGCEVRWQSENDPYCCRVLAKHWPDVPNLGDITTVDWSSVEPVDLICGGYPCQPFSLAGARAGDADARHLWPYFADALRNLRPRWALLENVPGHLSLGFGRVLGDLAELGYDTDWDCIPAAAVGAPHLRYRIFVVAHTDSPERGRGTEWGPGRNGQPGIHGEAGDVAHADGESESGVTVDALEGPRLMVPDTDGHTVRQQPIPISRRSRSAVVAVDGVERHVADTNEPGSSRWAGEKGRGSGTPRGLESERLGDIGSGNGGVAGGHWASEPDVGRVAHGIPHRVDRLRALGNAVVPQVAEYVGRRILEAVR